MRRRERVTLNPIAEDSSLASLDFVGLDPSWGIYLLGHSYPTPELATQTAGSADTEGDPVIQSKYGNRVITERLRVFEPEDSASTNLATNPLAALGVTGWAGVSLVAGPTRVLPTNTPPGIGADTAIEASTNAASDFAYHDVAVTNGKTYRASMYAQLAARALAGIRIAIYNAAGAAKKAEGVKYETVDVTEDGWVRLDVSFVADATATWRVGVEQVGIGTTTFRATGVLVEESPDLGPFFCGESPGCDWSGARHASTSTRPEPDGTRFSRIVRDITAQLNRITRTKSGTLRRIGPGFEPITYDLRVAKINEAPQDLGIGRGRAEIELGFEALPFGREPEELAGENEEKTLPVNTFTVPIVGGDVPALGRLQLEDRQAVNQQTAWWGIQRETYSSAATADLFYQAESLTPLGEAAKGALAGSSGETIRHLNLLGAYQGVCSTKVAASGLHLTHIGTYKVLARIYRPTANTGAVSVMWSWAEGDFLNTTENEDDAVTYEPDENEGKFSVVELGTVTLTGDRWEGRLLAKSTVAGDDLYVDYIHLIPTDEGSGRLDAGNAISPPTTLDIADRFQGAEGAATGKSAEAGGIYVAATNSDTTDFNVAAGKLVRTAVSDTGALGTGSHKGRGLLSSKELTDLVAINSFKFEGAGAVTVRAGQIFSYIDNTKFILTKLLWGGTHFWLYAYRADGAAAYGDFHKIEGIYPGSGMIVEGRIMTVVRGNLCTIYIAGPGEEFRKELEFEDSMVGAKGKFGIYDEFQSAGACNRYYDDIEVWAPTPNAAVFASQYAEVLDDRVRRRSSDGATFGSVPYQGDHLLVPPSGPEQRPVRVTTKLSRNPAIDAGIDDQRTKLYVTPRRLLAPPT